MPNDAKLGLVVGVGLVIAIGVLYFRKDASAPSGPASAGAAVQAAGATLGRGQYRPTRGRMAARSSERQHVVVEGDTLAGLAERYYGDAGQEATIRQANADVLAASEELSPGTVLRMPER